MAGDKTITVVRFEVDFESGGPTSARIIAYESFDDRFGYAVSAMLKSDPHNKLLKPAILALAQAWPDTPEQVQIRVNDNREVVGFIFSGETRDLIATSTAALAKKPKKKKRGKAE
jgi:hypothetical protein